MTEAQWNRFLIYCNTGKYPPVPTYKAEYVVEADPMTLEEYCARQNFSDLGRRNNMKAGYWLRYKSILGNTRVGWMPEDTFKACFRQIDS